ncbi:mechanosensitive ion channel family protein [Afifella pfennigii]|uniref:mechanosensitive ion channel family protein n=1 Tax=Afifella pfennigii TaxID=209897 RepID=UPI00047B9AEE|nr:mechanosensitive ion channel family protein [Afifella pfennigii]
MAADKLSITRLCASACAGILIGIAVLLVQPAAAQGTAESSKVAETTADELAPLNVGEREALVGKLTDEQARGLLLYYLQQSAPAAESAAGNTTALSSIAALRANGTALRENLVTVLARADDLFGEYGRVMQEKLGITIGGGGIAMVIAYILGLSLAGAAAEYLYRMLTRGMIARYEAAPAETVKEKLKRALGQLGHSLGAIAVFAGGFAAAFLSIWSGHVERRDLVIVVLLAILMTRVAVALTRFIFLPDHPRWRIMPVDDEAAAHFVRGTRRVAVIGSLLLLFGALGRLWGVDHDTWRFGALVSALIFTSASFVFLWRYRRHLLRAVDVAMGSVTMPRWAGGAASWSWYALALAYVATAFLIGVYNLLLGFDYDPLDAVFGFIILFVLNPYVTAVASGILAPDMPVEVRKRQAVYVTDPDDGERIRTKLKPVPADAGGPAGAVGTGDSWGPAVPEAPVAAQLVAASETPPTPSQVQDEAAVTAVSDQAPSDLMHERHVRKRVISMAVLVVSLFAFALVIGIDIYSKAQDYPLAQFALRVLLNVGLVALLGYVAWTLVASWIDRKLAEEKGKRPQQGEAEEGPGGAAGSRLQTILPIVRRFVQISIAVMAVMIVLSSMGVNIGPLIAGAGVIGLAVGFGAQTLVKDLISGLFFLMDDAFRMGEYVEVGGIGGTVERFNARSLVLRHYLGPVYTIPYGAIGQVTNYSRDWVIMKLRFRVPFDTDIDLVRKIFKRIGAEMLEDPEIGPCFLQPFKSQGVTKMDDSGFIVSGKFMAKPNQQWGVRKVLYQKIQQAFAENGIKFAPKRVIVDTPTAGAAEEDHERGEAGSAAPSMRARAAAATAVLATEEAQGAKS